MSMPFFARFFQYYQYIISDTQAFYKYSAESFSAGSRLERQKIFPVFSYKPIDFIGI